MGNSFDLYFVSVYTQSKSLKFERTRPYLVLPRRSKSLFHDQKNCANRFKAYRGWCSVSHQSAIKDRVEGLALSRYYFVIYGTSIPCGFTLSDILIRYLALPDTDVQPK
ncbi:hypothetical protein XPA_001850 [Xanthoria parietina]